MTYFDFLNHVIDEGIAAANADYTDEEDLNRLAGSVAGLEACRQKNPAELNQLWTESRDKADEYYNIAESNKALWCQCYNREVEWVCNVMSVGLISQGHQPILYWLPTAQGLSKAQSISTNAAYALPINPN